MHVLGNISKEAYVDCINHIHTPLSRLKYSQIPLANLILFVCVTYKHTDPAYCKSTAPYYYSKPDITQCHLFNYG